jgi:ribose transport system substrate-binding protein
MDLITQGVDGIATTTMDSVTALSWVESAKAAHIPYVSVTQQVGDPHKVAFRNVNPDVSAIVAEDYTVTGQRLAKEIVERGMLPRGKIAKIGMVEGQPGYAMVDQLNKGFTLALDEAGVKYKVVFAQPTDWTPAKGQEVCANGLIADPDIDIFFSHAEDMAIGCAKAVEDAGAAGKIVSAAGGSKLGAPLVRSGKIALSTCVAWTQTGEKAAKALIDAVADPSAPKGRLVETKPELIDANNVDKVCNPQQW